MTLLARPWSLRSRLLVGIVALLLVLGTIVGALSSAVLERNLTDRLDRQLAAAASRSSQTLQTLPGGVASPPSVDAFVLGEGAGAVGMVVIGRTVVRAGYLLDDGTAGTLTAAQVRTLAGVRIDGTPHSVALGALGDYRVLIDQVASNAFVVVGLSLAEVEATVGQLRVTIALVTALALVLAVGLGLVVVHLALRPLDRVVETATHVAALPLEEGDVALVERAPEAPTEVGRMGAALNRLLERVESALGARQASEDKLRRFVADASHELRTPLASIRGYSEFLRGSSGRLNADGRRSVERIEAESLRMSALVDELLLLARLDAGPALAAERVDLARVLAEAVGDAHAASPDHDWRLDVPPEPVEVVGDPARLHQVVANLLGNARAHTPPGTTVTATVERTEGRVRVTVADDGPGIPAELRPRIFERFVRGEESRTRAGAGGSTGLGLSIVQAIMAAHGGEVALESEPGRTVFTVELPPAP